MSRRRPLARITPISRRPAMMKSTQITLGHRTRRAFLGDVGRGGLVASVGSALAAELGLASAALADDAPGAAATAAPALSFGAMEPLVCLMQETPADRLLPALAEKLKGGTDLR